MSEPTAATATPDETLAAAEQLTHEQQALGVVRNYMLGTMGAGLVPLPFVDITLVGGIQLKMLHSLAQLYGQAFSKEVGKSIIGALVGGVLPAAATGSLAKLIPGVGTVAGMVSMSALSGAATYALGKVFIQHFESGGTFLTFEPDAVRDYFAEALEEGKKVAANLRKTEASADPMK